MPTAGVISPNFTIFIEIVPPLNPAAPAATITVGALGFQYEIAAIRVQQDAATGGVLTIQQTDNVGLQVATATLPAAVGTLFVALNATRANRQIGATIPLFISGAGLTNDLEYIAIDCIGRQGISPPTPFTGIEGLTLTGS